MAFRADRTTRSRPQSSPCSAAGTAGGHPALARFTREASGTRQIPVDSSVRMCCSAGAIRKYGSSATRVPNCRPPCGPHSGDLPREDRPNLAPAGSDAPWKQRSPSAVAWAVDHGLGLREIKDRAADAAVEVAMERSGGNVHSAAARLGLTDRAVQQRQARKSSLDSECQTSEDSSSATSRQ
jgi:hypothetical protein